MATMIKNLSLVAMRVVSSSLVPVGHIQVGLKIDEGEIS